LAPGDHRTFPLYIVGYGVPMLIATTTYIVAMLVSEAVSDVNSRSQSCSF
jgi:hypothetical protein